MVRIPNIKIPSVRVGSIGPTSNIGTGGATPAPPTPITYLTQWQIVGNSEVHGNEIWSCGEYSATDGKYHILVQPQGGSIVDIALDEPLRKVNDVADSIEFPSGTDGKALVTRPLGFYKMEDLDFVQNPSATSGKVRYIQRSSWVLTFKNNGTGGYVGNVLCTGYSTITEGRIYYNNNGIGVSSDGRVTLYDEDYCTQGTDTLNALIAHITGMELIAELATPTTELVDAPQIEEAESYTMVISQGAKSVEWSSFETE